MKRAALFVGFALLGSISTTVPAEKPTSSEVLSLLEASLTAGEGVPAQVLLQQYLDNYPVHVSGTHEWMQPMASITGLYHFNQERVTRLPQAAVAFARTEDYDNYGYTLGDNIMCFQGHPEQPYRAMVNFLNTTDSLSTEEHARAMHYIEAGEPDSHIWGEWMMRFFVN